MISVIIPVYNGEKYLAEAIDSVLSQTVPAGEILVVDDGSTDGAVQVARAFGDRVRYFHQVNGGIGAARNRGVENSRGEFLAFLDADDIWERDKLALQMAVFAGDTALDIVFGHTVQFLSPELNSVEREKLICPAEPKSGYFAGTMMIRRESFFRVGLFETDWQVGEFIDWYAKAMEARLKSCLLPDVVVRRRLHGNNTTLRKKSEQSDYLRVLKASLDRRRAQKI